MFLLFQFDMAVLKQEKYFQQYHSIQSRIKENHTMKILVIAILSGYDGENLSSKTGMKYPLILHLETSDFPSPVLIIINIL